MHFQVYKSEVKRMQLMLVKVCKQVKRILISVSVHYLYISNQLKRVISCDHVGTISSVCVCVSGSPDRGFKPNGGENTGLWASLCSFKIYYN